MHTKGVSRSHVLGSLAVFAIFLLCGVSHASAQTIASVQTQELLPPGQDTCQAISVSSVQPYVYGGMLESFNVTVSSNSYVGLIGQAGGSSIPMRYITRWAGTPGGMLFHVDTPTTPVGTSLPVSLTLISSVAGQPTCISVISFTVTGNGTGAVNVSVSHETGSTPVSTSGQSTSVKPSGTATGEGTAPVTATTATSSASTTSVSSLAGISAAASAVNVGGICAGSNAYRLWFILLAVYLILVAIVVFAEPWFLKRSVLGSTAAILVPLILLLAFWYFSSTCRAAAWIPVAACIIAIAGLFIAFREYEMPPAALTASSE